MVVRGVLARVAGRAPAPVFAVAGAGARDAVQDLGLQPGLQVLDAPGGANVLVVAGAVPDDLAAPLAQVHDGLSHPRCTLWWTLGAGLAPPGLPVAEVVTDEAPEALVHSAVRANRQMLTGERASEPAVLPDVDPAPWRGVGPYGQGGTGMTGGVPYGRPMAEVAPDRDGLRLDQVTVRIGPFFNRFPPGLVLELQLQGDVVQGAAVGPHPYLDANPTAAATVAAGSRRSPFVDALTAPVAVAAIEVARARSHLRWVATALVAHELPALGCRVLRLARRVQAGDSDDIEAVRRALRRARVLGWATAGVGHLGRDDLVGLAGGPVARAGGVGEDARIDDPAYETLGFEPIIGEAGDASARWTQRLNEAAQALVLAERAGAQRREPTGLVESPRGRLDSSGGSSARLLSVVPRLVEGLEWGDAITAVVSLDLDLDETAAPVQPERSAWTR